MPRADEIDGGFRRPGDGTTDRLRRRLLAWIQRGGWPQALFGYALAAALILAALFALSLLGKIAWLALTAGWNLIG